MQKLKVAIISKADKTGGGASRVADDLCDLLTADGHQADHWLGVYAEEKPFLKMMHTNIKPIRLGIKVANRLARYAGFPDTIPFEYLVMALSGRINSYDILHFHDLYDTISPLTLYWIAKQKPVVWTFHDCSPFTAACHYPFDCEQFKTVCINCPQKNEWPIASKMLSAKKLYNLKRYIHSKDRIKCIACSDWMSDTAMSSGMFRDKPEVVVNGVDVDFYQPFTKKQKMEFRRSLKIPADRKVVVLTSPSIRDKRKGIVYAINALKNLKGPKPFLILVGKTDSESMDAFKEFECHFAGYVDYDEKRKYFAGADLFLFCSLADNLPLVVLETMACGIPTVGFKTGGIPEIVIQDKTGFLVEKENGEALVKAFEYALGGNVLEKWGKNARERAENTFSHTAFLENHLELYYRCISEKYSVK